jgi:hypothetical protein
MRDCNFDIGDYRAGWVRNRANDGGVLRRCAERQTSQKQEKNQQIAQIRHLYGNHRTPQALRENGMHFSPLLHSGKIFERKRPDPESITGSNAFMLPVIYCHPLWLVKLK